MDTLVVTSTIAVGQRITTTLENLTATLRIRNIVPFESAVASVSSSNGDSTLLVLACSSSFSTPELAVLKQLGALFPERIKVVAVGRVGSSDRILEIVRCGAIDFLDIDDSLPTSLQAVVDRIQSLDRHKGDPGKLFTVVSPVGGSGASFLACNLAAVLAQKAGTCCLVDLHLRGGDQAHLLNLTPRHSLASLAAKVQHLDSTMFEQSLTVHESGVHLLAGPEPFADYRQVTTEGVHRILGFARARFPYVVVDLEDIEHAEQMRTLASCDRALILLRPDYVALSRCKRYLDHLSRAKIAPEHITVVVNRTGQPRGLPLNCMAEALGFPLVHCIPNDPAAVSASYNLGTPLAVSDAACPASTAIRRVVAEILGEPNRSASVASETRLARAYGCVKSFFSRR